MKCLAPRHIVNKYTGKSMWVACNTCSHCLENRREQWLFRLLAELKLSYFGCHLTLQFDDEHLGDNILDKRDLQLFFKRLRHHFDFTYYAIGEYGTEDHRKHHHVAMFVKSPVSFDFFHDCVLAAWPNGYVFFTSLKRRRLAYVLHYHIRPKEVDGKPTFAVCSNGLGSFCLDDEELRRFCISNNTMMIVDDTGKKIPLPRYYRKKFDYILADVQTKKVKTQLDVISSSLGVPIEELTQKQISSWFAHNWLSDQQKRMLKYNSQIKNR